MTTRTPDRTSVHDARHCGHVGRSDSPYVKRASILYTCEVEVPGFVVPSTEPAPVMALLAAMRRGVACDSLAEVTDAYATVEAAATVAGALVVPATLLARMVEVASAA